MKVDNKNPLFSAPATAKPNNIVHRNSPLLRMCPESSTLLVARACGTSVSSTLLNTIAVPKTPKYKMILVMPTTSMKA